jgi:hypothetical protein
MEQQPKSPRIWIKRNFTPENRVCGGRRQQQEQWSASQKQAGQIRDSPNRIEDQQHAADRDQFEGTIDH